MTFSYSDVQTYQRCPKKFEYRCIHRLEKAVAPAAMRRGTWVHALLAEYYGRYEFGKDEAYQAARTLHEEMVAENVYIPPVTGVTWPEGLWDDPVGDEAWGIFSGYLDYYGDTDTWKAILHVEESFKIDVGGIFLTFTPDLVVQDIDDSIWVVDHKTRSAIPDAVPFADLQARIYLPGVREVYPNTKGFIFNYMRTKIPAEPRLAKTGKKRVAYLSNIDTTYDALREFLVMNAPDLLQDPDHQARLQELRDGTKWYWREQVYVSDQATEVLFKELGWWLAKMDVATAKETSLPRTFLDKGMYSCEGCTFYELCRIDLNGGNREQVLLDFQERTR